MNEEQKEQLFDLLTKKAIYGLDEAEQNQLGDLDSRVVEIEFASLELTAAAISMAGLSAPEAMPAHLFAKIAADAEGFVQPHDPPAAEAAAPWPPATQRSLAEREIFVAETPRVSIFSWLGWAAAAAACIALAVNIWFSRAQPQPEVVQAPRTEEPKALTPAELREQMLRSNAGMIKADWAAGNVDNMKQISGDIVWSDEKQAGYMRFRGLPPNDPAKETYQLWIFDKTQDKKTPIDGGTFDVSADGEVVIAINAKLKASSPEMFAITVEQPGGVVVSKREKLAAIAKVEARAS